MQTQTWITIVPTRALGYLGPRRWCAGGLVAEPRRGSTPAPALSAGPRQKLLKKKVGHEPRPMLSEPSLKRSGVGLPLCSSSAGLHTAFTHLSSIHCPVGQGPQFFVP